MTNSLEKRILEKIKKDSIKPKSKISFVIKNSLILSFFIISIILGALSFSVLFYIFSNNQNIIFESFNVYQLKNAIIFWLILLTLFIIGSTWNNKLLKNSYKYESWVVILFNISFSLIVGVVLFYIGVGQKTDEISSKHLGFYQKNIKITEIKKEIFLEKLRDIGITKELLLSHPELKKKIEWKFKEKVMGKKYINMDNLCSLKNITCAADEIKFKDSQGCGCKKIYR